VKPSKLRFTLLVICSIGMCVLFVPLVGSAQELAPEHAELTNLREKIFASYEARNLDALLDDVHPDVIATWQNGFRARGHDEVRKFYSEMLQGDKRIVKDVKSKLTVDKMSVLHGDKTAVACGGLTDAFVLASGGELSLESKWTATMVKDKDRWLVASFHVSSSIFENPVLSAMQTWFTRLVGIVGVVAMVLGAIFGFMMARRK
jgi:ketosteroid isomerase-like protein